MTRDIGKRSHGHEMTHRQAAHDLHAQRQVRLGSAVAPAPGCGYSGPVVLLAQPSTEHASPIIARPY